MTGPRSSPAENDIRIASASELPAVLALIDRLTSFDPPAYRDAATMAGVDRQMISAAICTPQEDEAVFVLEADTQVAGVLHVTTAVDYYTRRANAHIATLVVDVRYEGRGLGARLLERAEAWARARGDDWVTLAVFPQNTRAVAMYERNGFGPDMARYLKPLGRTDEGPEG